MQNEPQNRTPSGYPGTDMPSAQEEKVIEDLGPMLHAAGLRTQIFAYDHNWTEHPNDVASTPPDETADINAYPQNVLNSPAAKWVSGVAYHCYYGDPSAMTTLHNQFPDTTIYLHGVLGQPVRRPGEHVLRHAQVARPQPDHRLAPATGPRPSSTGTWPWTRPAARTWAAAPPAPASSPSAPATP